MTTTSEYTDIENTPTGQKLAGPVGWLDERLGLAGMAKKNLRKVFPEHWSFMLGEIALWSFVVLLISGVFLTFWFRPSMAEVIYEGSYDPLRGLHMSEAMASTLHISFDVRGGLLMRQMHHWAAMIFIASMMGVITGIFGGVLRDIVCNEVPMVFRDGKPYAICAFLGNWLYLMMRHYGVEPDFALWTSALFISGLRLITWKFDIQMGR